MGSNVNMGVSLFANNGKCPIEFSMHYGEFMNLRNFIGGSLDEVGNATYKFLTQPDCVGELSYRECKELLDKITPLHNDSVYGYSHRKHSFEDFKTLLQYCYSHRTALIWC